MTEYFSHLKELASTEHDDFYNFSIMNRAQAYALKIKSDTAWVEEILVGEGEDSTEFLLLLTQQLLSFVSIPRDKEVLLQAHKELHLVLQD